MKKLPRHARAQICAVLRCNDLIDAIPARPVRALRILRAGMHGVKPMPCFEPLRHRVVVYLLLERLGTLIFRALGQFYLDVILRVLSHIRSETFGAVISLCRLHILRRPRSQPAGQHQSHKNDRKDTPCPRRRTITAARHRASDDDQHIQRQLQSLDRSRHRRRIEGSFLGKNHYHAVFNMVVRSAMAPLQQRIHGLQPNGTK